MVKKNYYIYTGHSLNEYQNKYANKGYKVIDKAEADKNPSLLENKTWWRIQSKYFEVPPSKTVVGRWWKNITTASRIIFCTSCAVIVGCAVAIPVIATSSPKTSLVEVSLTTSDATATRVMEGEKLIITLKCTDSNKEVKSIEKVTIEGKDLQTSEYSFNVTTQKITIAKEILDKHPGSIKITPVIGQKEQPATKYSITVSADEGGTVKGGGSYESGTEVTVIATPNQGYSFDGWYEKDTKIEEAEATYTFTVTGKRTLVAKFAVIPTYNIDWKSKNLTGHGFADQTLYNAAKNATTIKFIESDSVDGELCGENDDPVYASYEVDKESGDVLTVWAKDKIVFNDDDNIDGNGVFSHLTNTKSIIFDNIDTSEMSNFAYFFARSYNLESLDLKNLDFSKGTNFDGMFNMLFGESKLSEIKNLKIDTSKSKNVKFSCMFYQAVSLKDLDLSLFDTSNVTSMDCMFLYCNALESVNLSSFDTSNVTTMELMFSGCNNLKSLDVSKFNTSNVEDMSYMFNYCLSLKDLDLSTFDTSKVKNMRDMFSSNNEPMGLKSIYVSDKFVTDLVLKEDGDQGIDMFKGCSSLVGAEGTACDGENNTDAHYACIDDPQNGNPGYFTNIKDKVTEDKYFSFNKVDESYYEIEKQSDLEFEPSLVIPSEHESLPVTVIAQGGFGYLDVKGGGKLKLLSIPSSITHMYWGPFCDSIDTNTEIIFKDTTSTWKIIDISGEPKIIKSKFNPSTAEKSLLINYLTGDYSWEKNS